MGTEEISIFEERSANSEPENLINTKTSGYFKTHREWFQSVITEGVVLCYTSALELLGMFSGFTDESLIDVYALTKGRYKNIEYHLVDTYDGIEITEIGGVRCTSFEQTINDMLGDIYNADEWALTEALSNYFFTHNESFSGLHILPQNETAFENIKGSAIEYYNGG